MPTTEIEKPHPPKTAQDGEFESWDGTRLYYRTWAPAVPSDKALILLHRGHEHSGRFQDVVERLQLDDFWMFAWDARGHGQSPGERGYADSFQAVVRDLDSFVTHLSQAHDIAVEEMAIVANSIGSVVASTWLHDYAPPLRAIVLATPAFRVKLYVPLAIPGLRLLQQVRPKAFVKSYVKPTMLTHDAQEVQKIKDDILLSRNIAVNVLLDMHDTSTRIMHDAGAIVTPTLILSAGADWVVHQSAQRKFFDRISSERKEFVTYPGFYHAVLHEKQRDQPITKMREFITQAFSEPPSQSSLLDADKQGYTKEASDEASRELSPLSPRRMYYATTKYALGIVGRLSEGIRIGWQTGFNSGKMLDHVYRNQAQGISPLGRWIDRIFLNAPGWRGIRQRKVHLEQLLQRAIDELLAQDESVRLLDVAAGPGRYVLDLLTRLNDDRVSAVLRDRDPANLEFGRKIAAEQGIPNVRFEVGDAFDEASLAAIEPRANIAIVSGLYELFSDNQRVAASLRGLSQAMSPGGYLLYTNQPWHPQLELIARSLVGMDGKPWVMRCRTQLEMDQLVRAAGFEKVDMLNDKHGIFSVSLAQRVDSA